MNIVIAFALLTVYVTVVCTYNQRIPDSLSQTVFFINQRNKWIWTLLIFSMIILVSVPMKCLPFADSVFEKTSGQASALLMMVAMFLLAVVGVTPLNNGDEKSMDFKVHMVSAWTSGIASTIAIAIERPLVLLCWVPWLVTFIWTTKDRSQWRTARFWATLTCFISVFIFGLL